MPYNFQIFGNTWTLRLLVVVYVVRLEEWKNIYKLNLFMQYYCIFSNIGIKILVIT